MENQAMASPIDDDIRPPPICRDKASPILRYGDPVLARPHEGFGIEMDHDSLPQYVSLYASHNELSPVASFSIRDGGVMKGKRRPHPRDDNTATLKAIIPNKEWVDEDGEWVQTVSSTRLNRAELASLETKVNTSLANLQARPGAVCAVREKIFSELYDELIREVTLECPERGLLLLRLRDETRMNLETYTEIYRDSIVYSGKKSEGAREGLGPVRSRLMEIKEHNTGLQVKIRQLEAELAVIGRSNAYAKGTTDQEYAEKLQIVKSEKTALEAAIVKSRKRLNDAHTTAFAGT